MDKTNVKTKASKGFKTAVKAGIAALALYGGYKLLKGAMSRRVSTGKSVTEKIFEDVVAMESVKKTQPKYLYPLMNPVVGGHIMNKFTRR